MPDQLTIRPVTDEDIEAVVNLWKNCNLTRPWNNPQNDISFARVNKNSEILVGYAQNELIASVMTGHDGHRGAIYYMSVHPDYQGRGYGRDIMQAAEKWLSDIGIWKINLLIRADNRAVIEFYESLGYEDGQTIQMGKRLQRESGKNKPNRD